MITVDAPVHALIVLGAGAGDDLSGWRALKPKRLVLVEPNPELARVLAKKIRAQAGEEVIKKACVVQEVSTVPLQVLSMAFESGLYAPGKALRECWPNIAVTSTPQVEAEPIARLVSGIRLSPEENNVLILDAPGAEAELLQALLASSESKVFSTISVRTAPRPLYESNACQETVEAVLRSALYDLKQAEKSDISPHVNLNFMLDSRAVLIAERDSKIAALEQQLHELAQARKQEITALRAELAQSNDAQKCLAEDKEALITSKVTLAKENADLQAKLVELQKQLEDQMAKTTALESTNKQLESTNQELTARQALMNEELVKAEAQLELIKDLLLKDEVRL
jgi:FkbM family methyltransferase